MVKITVLSLVILLLPIASSAAKSIKVRGPSHSPAVWIFNNPKAAIAAYDNGLQGELKSLVCSGSNLGFRRKTLWLTLVKQGKLTSEVHAHRSPRKCRGFIDNRYIRK